jgi:hypothetical protein
MIQRQGNHPVISLMSKKCLVTDLRMVIVEVPRCGVTARVKHDSLKLWLRKLLLWAGIPVVCEVFNLFASSIPQAGLSRIEQGRKIQGLVPDYKLQGEQGAEEMLCELKSHALPGTLRTPDIRTSQEQWIGELMA